VPHRVSSHPTLGILLVFAGLSLFAVLACAVDGVALAGLTHYDVPISESFRDHAGQTPALAGFLHALTDLGDTPFLTMLSLTVLAILVAVLFLRGRPYGLVFFWVLGTAGAALNILIKACFQRVRPQGGIVHLTSWSFPSGHSMGSVVVYGMLAYVLLLAVRDRWARRAIVGGLFMLVGAIGFSRVYLGAHWPTDVVGGFAAGTAWLAGCITLCETMRRRRDREPIEVPIRVRSEAPVLAEVEQ
jgi:membrane-associated phospholipid phosphatase